MTQDRRVSIIGLGYVGLPLAIAFAEAGLEVEGVDASPARVAELNARHSPIDDVSDERLAAALDRRPARGCGRATRDRATSTRCSCASPRRSRPPRTPTSGRCSPRRPSCATDSGPGTWSCSSPPPSRARPRGPFREVIEASGLTAGTDFDLAFAPERVSPGDPASSGRGVPRLVGGTTEAATQRAAALFRNVNDRVVEMSSPDAAEMAKLLENTFRNVNIAFVNQLALLCERMGLDVWEIIDAAATKPFGFMRFTPGPGRGRPLHPGGPLLPRLARPRVRLHRALHRARRRHQLRHAAPRGGPGRRGAQ